MEIFYYLDYLGKPFVAFKKAFATSKGLAVSVPTLAYISTFHIENQALIFFGAMVFFDFVTGILASFKKAKDEAKAKGKFATRKTTDHSFWARLLFKIKFYMDVVESGKLRLSLLKLIVYLFVIIGAKTIQSMFKIKPFSFSFSDAEWSITLISIGVCIAIEAHSIFVENFKALGFDFLDKIFSVFRSYKEIKKEFKDE